MKKKLAVMFALFAMLFFSGQADVSARKFITVVPSSEITFSGIGKYATIEEVKRIYGEPETLSRRDDGLIYFVYGNSWRFLCKPVNGQYYVYQMEVTKNNGITTPSGIHVGSTTDEVYAAYGDYNDASSNGSYNWNLSSVQPGQHDDRSLFITAKDNKVVNMVILYSY